MHCTLQALPVRCGDCFYVFISDAESEQQTRLLIDTGYANTSHRTIIPIIRELINQQKKIQLLIATHTDQDHIGGLKPLLASFGTDWFEKAWFNHSPNPLIETDQSGESSIKAGIAIRDRLQHAGLLDNEPILTGHREAIGPVTLTILSPDEDQFARFIDKWREEEVTSHLESPISRNEPDYGQSIETLIDRAFQPDNSWSNRSSIAVLLTLSDTRILFSADAHPDVLLESIRQLGYGPANPMPLQLMQVPHHASRGNTNSALMNVIHCQHFLISANAANHHQFPHKEALSRIVWSCHRRSPGETIHFYFTYPDVAQLTLFTPQECQRYKIVIHLPAPEQKGITLQFPH